MRLSHASLVLSLLAASCAAQTTPAPAYVSNTDFQKAVAKAKLDERSPNYILAADDWRKANKIAGSHCLECLEGIYAASLKAGDWKQAMKTAREMDAASAAPAEHAFAHVEFGRAAIAANNGKKQNVQQLEEAHTGLVQAESFTPAAWFYDGRILALMHKDTEASAAFTAYALKTRRTDPLLVRAQHFAERPELARAQMVPALVVTTLAGKHFNLDDMNGKVVLIDFWATWCGPCKAELPHMKKLAAQYTNEPFELISVSWDNDERAWKDFVANNEMTWNQYRDTGRTLSKAFGVDAIPHYFTIDANGVLTAENLGSGSNIDGRIRKLIKQAKDDREHMAAAAPTTTAGTQ